MALTRRSRRHSALLAVVAFVFAQLAIAAFACPMTGAEPKVEITANLCQMHSDFGDASADVATPLPPALPPPAVLILAPLPEPEATPALVRRQALAAGPPPPLIETTVLRL